MFEAVTQSTAQESIDTPQGIACHESIIRLMRECIAEYEPWLCGCEHEWRIADEFERGIDSSAQMRHMVGEQVLCADRWKNPLCAHVSNGYLPDPFGDEIRNLVSLDVLEAQEWLPRQQKLADRIQRLDERIGDSRHDEHRDLNYPLTLRQKLQQPIFDDIVAMQEELLSILDGYL